MNDEIKYPAILRSTTSKEQVVMAFSNVLVRHMEGLCAGNIVKDYNTKNTIDITHEYLSNTWGVVESKEHAEFIIELAELHGFDAGSYNEDYDTYFYISDDYFYISDDYIGFCVSFEVANSRGERQITIPLPPKAESKLVETKVRFSDLSDEEKKLVIEDSVNEEFELHQKKAVQNANCRCEFVDLETWPQVGDPVTVFGQQGDLVLPADANGMYVVESNGRYFIPKLSDMTKPKSKEDLLIEELQIKLCENNYVDNYTLANDIVNGMIEGLIYESK